ncbi:hypothetical protein Zm00014a_044366 [Zea mays]|uniref:Uncharacterized protein n=1 Tax=Zea mays TaxID=4577 RepID=A0A3L6DXZ8_MAIZE|nr:hypothetical protein Zm00014a_044366 [Zea mays]
MQLTKNIAGSVASLLYKIIIFS